MTVSPVSPNCWQRLTRISVWINSQRQLMTFSIRQHKGLWINRTPDNSNWLSSVNSSKYLGPKYRAATANGICAQEWQEKWFELTTHDSFAQLLTKVDKNLGLHETGYESKWHSLVQNDKDCGSPEHTVKDNDVRVPIWARILAQKIGQQQLMAFAHKNEKNYVLN